MNLLKAILHPGALRHRVYVVRDKATGNDIGPVKPLTAGDEFLIDFDTFPDNVDIIIMPGDVNTAVQDEEWKAPAAAEADAEQQTNLGIGAAPAAAAATEKPAPIIEPNGGTSNPGPLADDAKTQDPVVVSQFSDYPADPATWTADQKTAFQTWFSGLPTGADAQPQHVLGEGALAEYTALTAARTGTA